MVQLCDGIYAEPGLTRAEQSPLEGAYQSTQQNLTAASGSLRRSVDSAAVDVRAGGACQACRPSHDHRGIRSPWGTSAASS